MYIKVTFSEKEFTIYHKMPFSEYWIESNYDEVNNFFRTVYTVGKRKRMACFLHNNKMNGGKIEFIKDSEKEKAKEIENLLDIIAVLQAYQFVSKIEDI